MAAPHWEKRPFIFLLLAVVTILVGTIVTMVLPFAWVNTAEERIESVTPYSVLEQAGRDLYIREGCNNCHTQTVRPLVAEVLRYGDYSQSGEFVYDRPHLWGSRRTGPDLARLGGKYPDAWHYQHMEAPTAMIPKSNMPSYAFLNDRQVDPVAAEKAMQVLGFPYEQADIEALDGKTEMDAMVAYLQKLGTGIPWREAKVIEPVGELDNPFPESTQAIAAGKTLYAGNCAACHGGSLEGGIGPQLEPDSYDDAGLYQLIYAGVPDNGMPAFAGLGSEKIWQLVNFIRYGEY